MTSTKLKHPIIAGGVERRGGMADSSLSLGIVIGAAMAGSFKSVMGNSVAQVDRLDAAIKKQWLGKALTGDIVKLQNPIQSPLAEQEQAGGSSDKLAQKIRDFERKLAETNQKLSRHFIAIGGVVGEHGKFVGVALQKSAQPVGRDILKLSTVTPTSAGGIGEIGAAVGQAAAKMGMAIDMAGAEVDSAMTGLLTLFKLNQQREKGRDS